MIFLNLRCKMWKRWKVACVTSSKILLKRRIATRSGKGNQPLDIKTAVELPIFKLGLPNFTKTFQILKS